MLNSYINVYNSLRKQIISGCLKPGMKLPTHRRLCEDYSVAIATMTKAINRLKIEGLVSSYSGVGTMVLDPVSKPIAADNSLIFIIAPVLSQIYDPLTYAVNEVFFDTKWSVCIYNAQSNLDWYRQSLVNCRCNPPAGLILSTLSSNSFKYTEDLLPSEETKTVLLVHDIPGHSYDLVRTYAYAVGETLGDFIIKKGYDDIIYLAPMVKMMERPEAKTLEGLSDVLKNSKVSFDSSNIVRYEDTHSYGHNPDFIIDAYEFTMSMLKKRRPRLIIAGHDWIGIGIVKAIRDSGLKVPEDIAVISAEKGNNFDKHILGVTLTGSDNMFFQRARTAAKLLKSRLEGNNGPIQCHEIHGHLVEGETA